MYTFYTRARGLTMIEVIVYGAVFVLVLSALVSVLNYTYRSGRFVYEQADANNEVRKGVQAMVQAIRESAYADNGAYPLVSMSASSITLYSDTDNDGSAERITFTVENEILVKKVVIASGNPPAYSGAETTTSVAYFVRNGSVGIPLFTYYDNAGVQITDYTDITEVASVVSRLVVNLYPERAPEDYEIRSRASFRNTR